MRTLLERHAEANVEDVWKRRPISIILLATPLEVLDEMRLSTSRLGSNQGGRARVGRRSEYPEEFRQRAEGPAAFSADERMGLAWLRRKVAELGLEREILIKPQSSSLWRRAGESRTGLRVDCRGEGV